ncbi:MAG: hypothetical protein ACLSB9_06250 [Hydrogeniiclostridium mannosilyticum]
MSEGLLVIDKQTDLLSFNNSALRILGAKAAPREPECTHPEPQRTLPADD